MKAALIGTWHVHAEAYAREFTSDPRCELTAVWDPDIEKAKAFTEKFGGKAFCDIDEMYAGAEFDSVMICSATNKHVPLMVRAAEEGKHIFTEKVLALDTKGAEEIRDAVVKAGVKFAISYTHKANPGLVFAKKAVESGKLGEITYARVRNAHNGSLAGWLPPHFYDKVQCGGGAMMDLGAHPMYTLLWLVGEPESVTSTFTTVTGKPVEDNAVSVLRYANGAIGVSETGFVSGCGNYVLELIGTKGGIRIIDDQTAISEDNGPWQIVPMPEEDKEAIFHWINDVIDDIPASEFGVEEAVRLSRLMEAAYRSCEEGKSIAY